MTDFFIKQIPLPKSRPTGLGEEYQPTISPEMPLGSTEKAADAFNGVGSYHPSSPEQIDLSGLLIGSDWWKGRFNNFLEWIHGMNVQFYGWDTTSQTSWLDILALFFGMGAIVIAGLVVFTAVGLFIEWLRK